MTLNFFKCKLRKSKKISARHSIMAVGNKVSLLFWLVFLYGTKAAVWDFDYDYTGYTKHAEILVKLQ